MKKLVLSSFIFIFIFLFVNLLISSSKGKMGYSTKGCMCHGKLSAGNATIQLTSTSDVFNKKGFKPDSTYRMVVTLNGKPKTKYGGFNLKASHGKLTNVGRSTKIIGQEASHSNSRKTEWVLTWTAPNKTVDAVTFFYSGCLTDGNYKRSGDDPTVPMSKTTKMAK